MIDTGRCAVVLRLWGRRSGLRVFKAWAWSEVGVLPALLRLVFDTAALRGAFLNPGSIEHPGRGGLKFLLPSGGGIRSLCAP